MNETFLSIDHELMQFFNAAQAHSPSLDLFFFAVSKIFIWLPTFALLLFFIFKTKRRESILILIGIVLVFLITDRVTSGLMKPIFVRPRPSHDPAIMDLLAYAFSYRGGAYGFPSSHAGNSFAIATFLTLLFRRRSLMPTTMFAWAALCSYSRMYLGVHFPSDILVGAILGILFGWLSFLIYKQLLCRRFPSFVSQDEFTEAQVRTLCFMLIAQVFTIGSVSAVLR